MMCLEGIIASEISNNGSEMSDLCNSDCAFGRIFATWNIINKNIYRYEENIDDDACCAGYCSHLQRSGMCDRHCRKLG